MNLPMDFEHEFKWSPCNPKKSKHCEYLNLRKRCNEDINLDNKPILKSLPLNAQIKKQKIEYKKFDFFKLVAHIYKYLFILTDIVLSLILAYLFAQAFIFLQKDIMHKITQKKFELEIIKKEAQNNYLVNMCNMRVPAMNKMCNEWENIIKNGNIKYTSVLFEVFSDVCNNFIGRISWKSILVLSIFFIIYLKYYRFYRNINA